MSQIKFFHSGGGHNSDPKKDLGDEISTEEIGQTINNLFDDVQPKQSRLGLIDYRCIYAKNTGVDTIRNIKLFVDWERKSGSLIDIGVKIADDVQVVNISGTKAPPEGSIMDVAVPGFGSTTVQYFPNIDEWCGEFQTALRGIDGLNDVRISSSGTLINVTFRIYFIGQAGSRKINPITITGLAGSSITVLHYVIGSPINSVACKINNIYQAPACATFDLPLRGSPYELGDLFKNDIIPIWLRRTTPRSVYNYIRDKVSISVLGLYP